MGAETEATPCFPTEVRADGVGCRAGSHKPAGGRAGCPRAAAARAAAARLVSRYQGSAGARCLIASHWSEPLRLAYLARFRRGRDDRRQESALNASMAAVHPHREAR
jgi:hypothetical protein